MKKKLKDVEVTGEVFTRPEVVSYMIDGVRHCGKFKTFDGLRVLEPSCGDGAFVIPLVDSWLAEKPDFHSQSADSFLTACDISARNINTRMRDLNRYPLMAAYLDRHAQKLKARYCARKHPNDWYRTLDRVKYALLRSPKILIPDIQLGGNVALDERGSYYPHHNVYWITSTQWNLKALCALLRSSFVTSQIRNISVQMRGGSIRYQAQNLRNVHIPAWSSLTAEDIDKLVCAYEYRDAGQLDDVVDTVVRDAASRQPILCCQAELFD